MKKFNVFDPILIRENNNARWFADFYDHFLLSEVEKQNDDFMEAILIGKVMAHYQLGLGDILLHQRVEALIEEGILETVSPAEVGKPPMRRLLRKIQK